MENNAKFSLQPTDGSIEAQFKIQLRQFSSMLARFGFDLQAYRDETWVKFRTLTPEAQKNVFEKFGLYHDLCVSASASGIALDEDLALVWWALKEFKLTPCSDFFDKVRGSDVIEIYNADGIQIFRNWAFFEISSYSMGDLFIYSWDELYIRDIAVTESMMTYAQMTLSGEHRHTIPCVGTPRHIVVEKLSRHQNVLDMNLNYLSPLFDTSGLPAAFFAVSSVSKVGKEADNVKRPQERPTLVSLK